MNQLVMIDTLLVTRVAERAPKYLYYVFFSIFTDLFLERPQKISLAD